MSTTDRIATTTDRIAATTDRIAATTDRITTPFGFESTAAEVAEGVDLSGTRAVVTGAASGIGVETARALAGTGAGVTLAVRDLDAGARVAADITATTGNADVTVAQLELTDRASIDAFAASWDGPLHLLVNNAGVMALKQRELTPEGYEMQFATNHLGHFALALGLHDALAADGHARIVSVSSTGHLRSPIIFEDIHFDFRPYEPFLAYGQSKTANVLFAVEATRRWAQDGITANALMPGGIVTNLQRHTDPEYMERARAQSGGEIRFKSVEQGAATSVLLAVSPHLEGIGGRYFDDCNEAEVLTKRGEGRFAMNGVAWYALDGALAQRLWDESLLMLGLTRG
jgi:NAD(P)-dependent dehydrogenase (short-subunit alcohol dehydrogenase family)